MRPLLLILVCILGMYLFKVFYINAKSETKASDTAATAAAENKSSKLLVDIYVAKEEDKSSAVSATGSIVPNEVVELRSEASGRLIQLNIKEGGYVQKGQLIAKLNDEDLLAQIKKLDYEEEFAQQAEARQKKLLDIDAISKEEYEMSVNRINTLGADKEFLQVQLEKTSLFAPFSGRLGLKNISEGAYVTPNTEIVTLVQTNPAKIDFNVPEKYAQKIKVGQKIYFSIAAGDESDRMEAQVIAIDPQIDENLRTLKVRAKAPNPKGKLLPGMFVQVDVSLGNEKLIMVPSESIIPILKGKKIFVMENGVAKERVIKTGMRTEDRVSVEEGLVLGDSVVVSALMSVKEDLPVQVRNLIP